MLPGTALAYEGARREEAPPAEPKQPTLTKPPSLERFVEAPYPEQARAEQLEGEVGMIIEIRADGTVGEVEVVRAAGHGFDEAAVAAVKQFLFSPAEFDDVPAAVRIEYVYRFAWTAPPEPQEEGEEEVQRPVTMRGVVLERATRKPIAGAFVACQNTAEETITEPDGTFELRPEVGICNLQITSPSHHPVSRLEQVVEGQVLELTYYLMPKRFGQFQTVVRGEREKREAVRRTLEREELQKVPGTFGDPLRVVQSLPGVARTPFGLGALLVRGAAPQETGVYIDGVQIPLLFHFLGGPSVINAEMLDRIDFYPGGFGPRYGRATGGILDAGLRRPDPDDIHGSFQVSLLDAYAFAEAPVYGDTSVSIAARRSYIDTLLPIVLPEDPRTGTISILPRYWDYQARVDHGKRGDRHHFSVMAFGSDDALAVTATGGQRNRDLDVGTRTLFHRARAGWTYRNGSFTNTLAPFVGFDHLAGNFNESLDAAINQYMAGVRNEATWELPGGHVWRLGADFQLSRVTFEMTVPTVPDYRLFPGERAARPPQDVERSLDNFDFGFYTDFTIKATDKLTLIPGLRVDRFRLHGRNRDGADPRLTARYQFTDRTAVKGNVGHYTATPDPSMFDPEFGNPNLLLPKAFQSSLGVEHKFTDTINVDVVGFYNRRYDMPQFSGTLVRQPDGSLKPEVFNNEGLGRSYGVELLLRHEITRNFFGWIAYTLSLTEERRRFGEYTITPWDQTHILAAVASYNFGNGWEVGGRFRLVSGTPVTPVLGATFDADTDFYRDVDGAFFSERMRTFHQLDLRIDKTWLFDVWKLGVFLDVQNVYWADNVEFTTWDYRYREKVEIPGIPILPIIGVKGSF